MINLSSNLTLKTIFITYKSEFKGTIFFRNEKDNETVAVEISNDDLNFITSYPNIMEKLIVGEELYITSSTGYLGRRKTEGPYCEQKTFESMYEAVFQNPQELIADLERKIKMKDIKIKTLHKIGNYYTE